MTNSIKHYQGNEITDEVISKIRCLAKNRYSAQVYTNNFSYDTPSSYADKHGTNLEDESVILGPDWAICYHMVRRVLIISDWISEDNKSRVINQSLEMYISLRNVLVSTEAKRINAYLRHDTSYPFYKLLLEKDYIDTYEDIPTIDMCSDEQSILINNIIEENPTFEETLERGKIPKEYEQFIFHEVTFEPTEKFQKKYGIKST